MALGDPINLRLHVDKQLQYEEEAAARNMGLRPYLRKKLEEGDDISEGLAELRTLVADGFARLEAAILDGGLSGSAPAHRQDDLLIEAILLLRSVVGEAKLGLVHAELRRRGLTVWGSAKGGDS